MPAMESLDALLADLQSATSQKPVSEPWPAPPAAPDPEPTKDKLAGVRQSETNGVAPPHAGTVSCATGVTCEPGCGPLSCGPVSTGERWPPADVKPVPPPQHAEHFGADFQCSNDAEASSLAVRSAQPLQGGTIFNGEEPVYEPQNIRDRSGVAVAMDARSAGGIGSSSSGQAQQVQPSKATTISLAYNLSELDMLLQDLNSSMLSANFDGPSTTSRSHGDYAMPGPRAAPVVPPKPKTGLIEAVPAVAPKPPATAGAVGFGQSQYRENSGGNPAAPAPASSATRELDELMNSLSQFKVSSSLNEPASIGRLQPATAASAVGAAVPVRAAGTAGSGGVLLAAGAATLTASVPLGSRDPGQQSVLTVVPVTAPGIASATGSRQADLDSLLGHLETDLTRQGASVAVRGRCAACSKPIAGQVITALGQAWHPEHFCCRCCGCELGAVSFFERDGVPYCEADYHEQFAPKCAACNGPISDRCVTAMDATWHNECFVCAACGRELSNEGFHEKDGQPFCRDDYFAMFAPKCGGCGTPIVENYISALSRHWHPQCFVCMECGAGFAGGSFFDHEGLPYCETHYHARKGSLCAGCQKPVAGRCIAAMGKKFHPEHFVCAFCLKQLNKGTFKEQNDKPYCHACFVKLFG